ncbi:hypothetical protein DYF88_08180 [Vibrio cholerae]|nr:hypothetical protein [Vibrio cholerae]
MNEQQIFDEAIQESAEREQKVESALQAFGQSLHFKLRNNLQERNPIELRWLHDLRNYYGKYDEAFTKQLTDSKKSSVFVGYTRSKTDAWVAQMTDLLFPADDKNYGISHTPVPELVNQVRSLPEDAPEWQQAQELIKQAKDKAKAMEDEIEDQLSECDYAAEARWMLHYAGVLGTGIIKGPILEGRTNSAWQSVGMDQTGIEQWEAVIERSASPSARAVMPWDFVPDMSATSIDDSEFTFERSYLTRKKLLKTMTEQAGYVAKNVRELAEKEPRDSHALTEDVLGTINQIRALNGLQPTYKDRRYEIWEYHGPIPREVLQEAGLLTEEEFESTPSEVDGVIVMSGCGLILKAGINPFDTEEWPYSVYCAEEDVSCIFGYGIPHLCSDAQSILNTAWRAMIDNGVATVGDQIVVNQASLMPADGDWSFSPLKVWKTTDKASVSAQFEAQKAFGVFSLQNRQAEYANIISMAKAFMDEESGLPMISQGEQGQVTPTLGGMSMLMNAANAVRRRQVKEWDDSVTKPLIRRFYAWNMQFSKKNEIKGDMQIIARGTTALLVKETQTAQLIELMDRLSSRPDAEAAFDFYFVYESLVKSMSMGARSVLRPREEYEAKLKQMQEAQQNQPQDPQLVIKEMEIALQREKMQHDETLAKFSAAMKQQETQAMLYREEMRMQQAMLEAEEKKQLELLKLAQQEKWNEAKLVTEMRKLNTQLRQDMTKFITEAKLKNMNLVNPAANNGLE